MRSELELNGRLEKYGRSPFLIGVLGLILAFVLFQGISLVVTLMILAGSGVNLVDLVDANKLAQTLSENASSLLIANTVGQVFGLLIPALLITRLHSSKWTSYLRIRRVDLRLLGLSFIALLVLIPVVQWFGVLSDQLPWPEWIRTFEQSQMDLIEQILTQDFSLAFTISMLAITPAICEEVLFRGYFQRQSERSFGIVWGIVLSGVVFGLYHLRLTQAIPLSMLGVFMAYLTWRTKSIFPAMLVHLANNSFAAILGKVASKDGSTIDLETFEIPLTIVVPSAIILVFVLLAVHRLASTIESHQVNQSEVPEHG